MTWHCYTHDVDVPARFECPECRADEAADHCRRTLEQQEEGHRDAERQHEEMQRSLSESEYRRANPGDYECPHCKYKSLKSQASRCPLCHGEIGRDYWGVVAARELADAERTLAAAQAAAERQKAVAAAEAAELIRTAPERAAAAERAALAAANAAAERQRMEQGARNKASVQYAFEGGASSGLFGLLLGAIIGFGKGCVNYVPSHGSLSEPFVYIPETALTVCIIGAVFGIVVGVIVGQNKK